MIKDIVIGQYIKGKSFIYTIDPRIKIILNLIYVISLFFVESIFRYSLFFILIFFICIMSKIKIVYLIKSLKPIILFIIFTSLFNIFLIKEGELWFEFYFIRVYSQGVLSSIYISLRIILLILGSTILTFTTSPIELTQGFEILMKPLKKIKVPVHEISLMISIALKFIPSLIEELDKIIKAQMSRGVDFETRNLVDKVKNIIPILIPLFVNSFRRADDLAIAMESRCYFGVDTGFKYRILKLKSKDYLTFIIVIILILLVICI